MEWYTYLEWTKVETTLLGFFIYGLHKELLVFIVDFALETEFHRVCSRLERCSVPLLDKIGRKH